MSSVASQNLLSSSNRTGESDSSSFPETYGTGNAFAGQSTSKLVHSPGLAFEPHLVALAKRIWHKLADDKRSHSKASRVRGIGSGISDTGLRRPILLMRSIPADDLSVLMQFHEHVSASVYRHSLAENSADLEFLDKLLLSDFVESSEYQNPLI